MPEPAAPLSLRLLGLYPKKAGSAAVGVAARSRLPRALREPLLGRFAAAYGVDLSEAEKPLGDYVSFLDFFTRRLKPGLRPQDPAVPGGLNSPVDGALIASGRVEEGTLIQAKGLPYRLDELLAADPLASRFEGGAYATLYLSPRGSRGAPSRPCTSPLATTTGSTSPAGVGSSRPDGSRESSGR